MHIALEWGVPEKDFWRMTIPEFNRAIEAKQRAEKARLQREAQLDYVLADLIGRSVARMYPKQPPLPKFQTAYSHLYDEEEKEKIREEELRKRDEASYINFKLFADSFNARHFKEV